MASKEQYVRFVGPYEFREITSEQFARVGVADHPPVRWDTSNGFQIKQSDLKLSDEQFGQIILADGMFRVVTAEQAKEIQPYQHRLPPAL